MFKLLPVSSAVIVGNIAILSVSFCPVDFEKNPDFPCGLKCTNPLYFPDPDA